MISSLVETNVVTSRGAIIGVRGRCFAQLQRKGGEVFDRLCEQRSSIAVALTLACVNVACGEPGYVPNEARHTEQGKVAAW